MAGTGAQKRKKCGFQKDKEWVAKFFGSLSFWTSNVDNVKEGFLYSLRNVSAWKRHFKKDSKYKHHFGSIEKGMEVFVY